jgi:hypothetical protein
MHAQHLCTTTQLTTSHPQENTQQKHPIVPGTAPGACASPTRAGSAPPPWEPWATAPRTTPRWRGRARLWRQSSGWTAAGGRATCRVRTRWGPRARGPPFSVAGIWEGARKCSCVCACVCVWLCASCVCVGVKVGGGKGVPQEEPTSQGNAGKARRACRFLEFHRPAGAGNAITALAVASILMCGRVPRKGRGHFAWDKAPSGCGCPATTPIAWPFFAGVCAPTTHTNYTRTHTHYTHYTRTRYAINTHATTHAHYTPPTHTHTHTYAIAHSLPSSLSACTSSAPQNIVPRSTASWRARHTWSTPPGP